MRLPPPDRVGSSTQHERGDGKRDADPRTPVPRASEACNAMLALGQALEREPRAAADESLRRRRLADHFGGRARGPRAIGVGPHGARAIGGLDRANRGYCDGGAFVHAMGVRLRARIMPDECEARR